MTTFVMLAMGAASAAEATTARCLPPRPTRCPAPGQVSAAAGRGDGVHLLALHGRRRAHGAATAGSWPSSAPISNAMIAIGTSTVARKGERQGGRAAARGRRARTQTQRHREYGSPAPSARPRLRRPRRSRCGGPSKARSEPMKGPRGGSSSNRRKRRGRPHPPPPRSRRRRGAPEWRFRMGWGRLPGPAPPRRRTSPTAARRSRRAASGRIAALSGRHASHPRAPRRGRGVGRSHPPKIPCRGGAIIIRYNHGSPVCRAERKRQTLRPSNLIWVMPAQEGELMNVSTSPSTGSAARPSNGAGGGGSSTSSWPASSASRLGPRIPALECRLPRPERAARSRCCPGSRVCSTARGCSPGCSARSSSASPVPRSTPSSSPPPSRRSIGNTVGRRPHDRGGARPGPRRRARLPRSSPTGSGRCRSRSSPARARRSRAASTTSCSGTPAPTRLHRRLPRQHRRSRARSSRARCLGAARAGSPRPGARPLRVGARSRALARLA